MARLRPLDGIGGFIADLPTPFDERNKVDWPSFEALCERQIGSGATAIVVGETMGEASVLSRAEHEGIISAAVKIARGRIAVIGGAGSNATGQAIELTAIAEINGADAVLSVVPYYNRPMQAGILAHFRAIAGSTGLPILLHDVPARTARAMSDETLLRLSQSTQFIGLNESTGSVERLFRLRSMLPSGFRLFGGNDANALAYLVSGGDGCISSVANLYPGHCHRIHHGCTVGAVGIPRSLWSRLAPLVNLLAGDSPVATLKHGLSLLGIARPSVRLPLVELTKEAQAAVAKAIKAMNERDEVVPGRRHNASQL